MEEAMEEVVIQEGAEVDLEAAQEVAVVLLEEAPEEMEEEIKELHRVVPVVSKINYLKG